jgi:hypothetical protein
MVCRWAVTGWASETEPWSELSTVMSAEAKLGPTSPTSRTERPVKVNVAVLFGSGV